MRSAHTVVCGLAILVVLLLAAACGGPAIAPTALPARPVVTILAPASGSQVPANQAVNLQVNGTDATGVTRVEIKVDGVLVTAARSQNPEGEPSLDAVQQWMFGQPGSHVISGQAYNAAGQVSDIAAVTVLVSADSAVAVIPSTATAAEPPADEAPTAGPPTDTASPEAGQTGGDSQPPTATFTPTPTASATPTPTPTATATRTPTPRPPSIVLFTASPASITAGQAATLSWEVKDASKVEIDNGVGVVALTGSTQVNPAATTTYRLRVTSAVGTLGAEVTVQVQPIPKPVIVSFAAGPATITAGQSTTLSWEVKDATQVDIDNGIGHVPLQGTRPVSPGTTTTYRLLAVNQGGSVTRDITVQVQAPAQAAWSNWGKLGGAYAEAPTVASWAENRLDVFVRGLNTHLMHRWWSGQGWSGWEDLGGELADGPGCVSWGPNRLDCFVRGKNDSELWHKWWNGQAWSGWEKLGGVFKDAPAVASWAPNRLDVFVRGLNNHLMHKWWDGQTWSGWEDLGGELADSPTCISTDVKHLNCFVRGKNDSELWHKWWDGQAWSGWEKLGGSYADSPTVASWGPNRLDVFVRGHNTHLMHRWWTNNAWSGWEDLGGELADGPACVSWAKQRLDCFVRGKNDSELWHKWYGTP